MIERPFPRWSIGVVVLLAALGAGCGGGAEADAPDGADAPVDTPAVVADTQLVVDSSGAVLEIVTRRNRPAPREVKPRAGSGDPDAPDVLRRLEPATVRSLLELDSPPWYLIDVRGPRAYAREGHLPGALLVPFDQLEGNLDDLHVRTDQGVLVYGSQTADGWRAGRLLASYGFPNVRVLEGGFEAWRRAGLPVEGGP